MALKGVDNVDVPRVLPASLSGEVELPRMTPCLEKQKFANYNIQLLKYLMML